MQWTRRVEIEDTYIECSEILSSQILVTSLTKEIALANAEHLCRGLITFSSIEGFLGSFESPSKTPDRRPGFHVLLRGMRSMKKDTEEGKKLFEKALTDVLCLTPHFPTVAVLDAVPEKKTLFTVEAGDIVRLWGDGYEVEDRLGRKAIFRIPVMTGETVIQRSFGVTTSIDGALELFCQDIASALTATKAAAQRVLDDVKGAFVMHPLGGVNGAKIGGANYKNQKATSTTFLCPTIRNEVADTRVPEGVNTVIEYLVWGLDIETVKKGLSVSLETITKMPGISKVSSFNQGGLWGTHKVYLRDLVQKD